MAKIIIKKVDCRRPEIVSLLIRLQKICLPSDTTYDVSGGYWWIAYDAGNAIGFAGLTRTNSWTDCGYLCRAGVLETHQGRGLQKRLIKARIAQAKKLKWNWLITDTHVNPASSNSLIKCGFKLFEPTAPWAFKTSLYWRKKLNAV